MKSMMRYTFYLFLLLFTSNSIATVTIADDTAWKRHTIDASSQGADGVRLADVNGDDLPDIATGWEEGGKIRIYLNPGKNLVKQNWPSVTVGEVNSPEDAVLVDLDNDGAMDVVSCCEGSTRSVFIHWAPKDPDQYLQSSAWQTEAIPECKNRMMWMYCVPMQVDNKHGIDLILGAKGENAQIGWLEAPPNPRNVDQWKWHPIYAAGWIMSIMKTDMDDDGDDDILVTDRKGDSRGCLWLENPGSGEAQKQYWQEHRIAADNKEVMFMEYADLDGDGQNEIAIPIRGKEMILLKKTEGIWQQFSLPLPEPSGTGKGIAIGDINLDGQNDLVFSCENAKGQIGLWWMNFHRSIFEPSWQAYNVSGTEGTKYDLVKLIDIDGDGDLDILTCEESENLGVIWYENPHIP